MNHNHTLLPFIHTTRQDTLEFGGLFQRGVDFVLLMGSGRQKSGHGNKYLFHLEKKLFKEDKKENSNFSNARGRKCLKCAFVVAEDLKKVSARPAAVEAMFFFLLSSSFLSSSSFSSFFIYPPSGIVMPAVFFFSLYISFRTDCSHIPSIEQIFQTFRIRSGLV